MTGAGAKPTEPGRYLLFLLHTALMDLDAYLPTALALHAARPNWKIRFVTFSQESYDLIRANATLFAGAQRCGELHFVDDGRRRPGRGFVARQLIRLRMLWTIGFWLLRYPGPILCRPRHYDNFPFNFFFWLARLRGGFCLLLSKVRAPDRVYHFQEAARAEKGERHIVPQPKLDVDAVVYYHDDQLVSTRRFSIGERIYDGPWIKVGMSNFARVWTDFVAQQAREFANTPERRGEKDYFAFYAGKLHSGSNLQSFDSVVDVFERVLKIVTDACPNAHVLVRPHPAMLKKPENEHYITRAIQKICPGRAETSWLHPEVLNAVSKRSFFFAPTNLMYDATSGAFIDCSDYKAEHYRDLGDVSIAHGYGPLHISPRATDFEERLLSALANDAMFQDPDLKRVLDRQLDNNRVDLKPFLALVEKKRGSAIQVHQGVA